MVGKLGKGRFYSKKQKGKVFSLLSKGDGTDKESFESGDQRKAFFGRREKIRASDRRSKHARAVDFGKRANKTLPISDKNVKKWRRNKNHYDLLGIDTPTVAKRARKVSKRLKKVVRKIARTEGKVEHIKQQITERQREHRIKRKFPAKHKLTGVERQQLYKLADRYDVARDLIDWRAYIDPNLNYYENKDILEPLIKALSRQKHLVDQSQDYKGQLKSYLSELEWRAGNAPTEDARNEARMELQTYKQVATATA